MAEKYFAELERMWQQNRETGPALQTLFSLPIPPDLRRPKALRGPDLVQELVRLAVMTEDMRFRDAFVALVEHRIVDRKFNFLPWEPQYRRQGKEKLDLLMCACIHALKFPCRSLRRACAELAARTRWEATSFAAAVKDLELLYRRCRHFDPDELEKSCRTSIPTTADD